MRVDLHIHSTASDGRWLPAQLVDQVRRKGIELFAVADHDTVDSVQPVEQAACKAELAFVRAVEISVTLGHRLFHILAYGIDTHDPDLLHILSDNRAKMESVDRQSVQILIDAGYDISFAEYEGYRHDATRGGWRALSLFMDRGFCRDVDDFFGRLFAGDRALTMPAFASPDETIDIIHQAGGTAICAHPGHSAKGDGEAPLDRLVKRGLDGLECYSPYHDSRAIQHWVAYCQQRDLLITAGSDCHGGFVGRALGEPPAYSELLNLGPLLHHIVPWHNQPGADHAG
jgi:3',5'-nucleoside bisphosphate phosphatase